MCNCSTCGAPIDKGRLYLDMTTNHVSYAGSSANKTRSRCPFRKSYPGVMVMQAVEKIVVTNSYPDLPYINDTCAKIYEPRRRDEEREHLASERKRALPPPREKRTAEEQARAEAQVAAIRKDFAIPEGGIVKPQQAPPVNYDSRHINRICVDLEQRKVRNAMRHEP